MNSPFHDIEKAFAPMFTDVVYITVTSGERLTVDCSIFPIERVDPFIDTDVEGEVKLSNLLVPVSEWELLDEKPQIGNTVVFKDGSEWKVETCELEQDWWRLEVRNV